MGEVGLTPIVMATGNFSAGSTSRGRCRSNIDGRTGLTVIVWTFELSRIRKRTQKRRIREDHRYVPVQRPGVLQRVIVYEVYRVRVSPEVRKHHRKRSWHCAMRTCLVRPVAPERPKSIAPVSVTHASSRDCKIKTPSTDKRKILHHGERRGMTQGTTKASG